MAIEKGKLQLEKYKFDLFMKEYKSGKKFRGHRLGQAFYNKFDLHIHEFADENRLKGLYELEGDAALKCINDLFVFN